MDSFVLVANIYDITDDRISARRLTVKHTLNAEAEGSKKIKSEKLTKTIKLQRTHRFIAT